MLNALILALALASVTDTDGDGLPDDLELLLSTSTNAAHAADYTDADTDNDGIPDGFEFVMTGEVSHSGAIYVTPEVRLVAYRSQNTTRVEIFGFISDDYTEWGNFDGWYANNLEDDPENITEDFDDFGTYTYTAGSYTYGLSVINTFIRESDLKNAENDAISIAIGGTLDSVEYGDVMVLFIDGDDYVWNHSTISIAIPYGGGNPVGTTETKPVDRPSSIPTGWVAEEVCGAIVVREPTATPGLLRSVVQSIGCASGDWACPAGICTMTSPAGQAKPVIDVFTLTLPPGS